jgi:hypothetical protein
MSESAIRAALYTAVSGVSGAGKVYDEKRRADTWPDFLALFKTTIDGTPQIRVWDINYKGFEGQRDPQMARQTKRSHIFWVQGYMRVNDATSSDKTFATLTVSVCNAIDANATLHSGVYKFTPPASLPEMEVLPLGDVLCHFAQIVVTVTEQVT